jgi:hypothetical protein
VDLQTAAARGAGTIRQASTGGLPPDEEQNSGDERQERHDRGLAGEVERDQLRQPVQDQPDGEQQRSRVSLQDASSLSGRLSMNVTAGIGYRHPEIW